MRTSLDGEPTVFIPGSSLKGVMRSHAETLLRTEGLAISDAFNKKTDFNSKSLGTETYPGSCPIGRTFGNLHVRGHVSVTDLVPGGREPTGSAERRRQVDLANRVELRNGVGIDRLLGSAFGGALFDAEAVVQGRFDGRILLVNAQLYQLALVLAVLRELDDGFLALGSSSTRGFGQVSTYIHRISIEAKPPADRSGEPCLVGVGALGDSSAYRLFAGDSMPLPDYVAAEPPRLFWRRWTVPGERWQDFSQDLLGEPWQAFLGEAKEMKSWQA